MRYLSFSLWGDKPIYNVGAIRNAELWKGIYPEWQMVVYYDNTVPLQTIDKLKELNVNLINMSDSKIFGCFWRFLISDKEDCEYSIFRDCDSRLTLREKLSVDEWINSGKILHIMRDHPAHRIPYGANSIGILAGMWGIKGKSLDMTNSIIFFSFNKKNIYGIDQTFLIDIFNKFKNNYCVHDEFFEKKPFPIKRNGSFFIGGRIDEFDKPVGNDHLDILEYENRLRIGGV